MSIIAAVNVARTGLQATEDLLHIKSTNIAGAGADAYKKQHLIITDLPYIDKGNLATPTSTNNTRNPTGQQMGLGVQSAGAYRDFSQGEPINSGNPLDLMIEGEGFLMVTLPDGTTGYSRIGALQLSSTGEIVMPKTGYVVQPGITLPINTTSININEQGQVYVTVSGSQMPQLLGQFQLATFFNPSGLKAIGDATYLETDSSGAPDIGVPTSNKRGSIKQGWREGSNVNAVEEMTDLIQLEKVYDMLVKLLNAAKTMWSAANEVGR